MKNQERFAELFTDYLEGELDDAGLTELRELLASDETLLRSAADLYQTHHLLGMVVDGSRTRKEKFVRETLSRLPVDSGNFVSQVMADIDQISEDSQVVRHTIKPQSNMVSENSRLEKRKLHRGLIATALIAVLALSVYSIRSNKNTGMAEKVSNPSIEDVTLSEARFAHLAHAKFFGELLPPVNSALAFGRDYVLMSGLVEIEFPAGASAILEGPAVFRVLTDECLALDVGRCSVHAPDGAEGFRIETPVTSVVDRGTRFAISVTETSETEVQVIEGAADVYQKPDRPTDQIEFKQESKQKFQVRMASNQAQTFTHVGKFSADAVPFNSSVYHSQLPDRVISYQTTKDASGKAEMLTSVKLQRDGRIFDIPVEDLIPIEVISFTGHPGHAHIATKGDLPSHRCETSSDYSLLTGVINPDGSREPLKSDPVLNYTGDSTDSITPGMAIRFQFPVMNMPGPDIVFFDLQTLGNPPDGDAFHVSPLKFKEGLKSHTIRIYDLTLESPAALELQRFQIHIFEEHVKSLEMLETASCASRFAGTKFRGLAVGIDLSDLGYENGESVDGLFIQDAKDDGHNVDPVFIGGLPSQLEVQNR
ncbi:FecR domain-containing protein [Rubinisphaera sp.]|uniref:FecR domain-containing protein n=1 Tax=Rubinisphaera sp. TaxID=2024857 RepID=UPI000C0C6424|nr:FecR domain-containing protein [Rubinisphaera sp.]MBV11331.1 iron dicitrate transport regulator FecR [Rubinisphaera sp.]HCS54420.1 iron dicitrate transport regulator FecR [Planctomycetaceae bacterium]